MPVDTSWSAREQLYSTSLTCDSLLAAACAQDAPEVEPSGWDEDQDSFSFAYAHHLGESASILLQGAYIHRKAAASCRWLAKGFKPTTQAIMYVLPAALEGVRVPKLASCQEGNAGGQQPAPARALQDIQAADLNTCTETSTDSHHGDIVCLQAGGQQGVRLRMVKKGSHMRVTASDPSGSQAPRMLEVPIDSFVDESSGEPLS